MDDALVTDDRPTSQLHDREDRAELRRRYYGLLQELRVVLPGVQVLVAFLLTVPFAGRFGQLDRVGRDAFGVALVASVVATVCLLTPTAFHRVAPRTARTARLTWAVRTTVAGLVSLSVALTSALFCISRFVFDTATATTMTLAVVTLVVVLWGVVPLVHRRDHD